jgi:hypothetical protein
MSKYEQKIEFLKGYFLRNLEVKPNPFKYLEDLEKEIGGVLPNDYKEFLIDYGSALAFHSYVIYPLLVPCPIGDWQMVGVFFGFLPDDSYNLVKNYHTFKDRLPPGFLSIACEGMGNLTCICFAGENRGYVYFWQHDAWEIVEEDGTTYTEDLFLAATSFDDFIWSLKIDDEEDEDD